MEENNVKHRILDVIFVTVGSLIAAVGFNTLFMPNHIVAGGMSGLAVAMHKLTGMSPDIFLYVTNIPLLVICWLFLGKENFFKTIYGSWIFPIFISLTQHLGAFTHDQFLGGVFGGLVVGFGLGLVFYGNSSTGGTGIIVQIVNKYTPISLGFSMVIIDGIVTIIGLMAFNRETVMYSLIALFIVSKVVDFVSMGLSNSKNVMILSKESERIQTYLMTEIERGVTEMKVTGAFDKKEKQMLMCVIDGSEYPAMQRGILEIDPEAFVVVMPASEVMGRGFSLLKHYVGEGTSRPL
ncbi:MAG: YitT family protein [Lactobacillales bacterium]|nr:YitT family protein [Lactobacillales bacterium]